MTMILDYYMQKVSQWFQMKCLSLLALLSYRVSDIWATLSIHLFTAFFFQRKPVAIAPILSWKTRDNRKQKNIYYNIEISYMQLQAHKHKYLYIITVQLEGVYNNKLPDNNNNNNNKKLAHKSQEIFSLTAYATYAWYLHNEIHNSTGCLVVSGAQYTICSFVYMLCVFPRAAPTGNCSRSSRTVGEFTKHSKFNISRHCNSFALEIMSMPGKYLENCEGTCIEIIDYSNK